MNQPSYMEMAREARMDFNEYFFLLALDVAKRSTCIRRQVGCIAVRNKRIIATGYNGAISSMRHCTPDRCYRHKHNIPSGVSLDMCYAVHAEQNVITQAAMFGTSIKDAEIYITTTPCITCLKLLIQSGVQCIYALADTYPRNSLIDDIIDEWEGQFSVITHFNPDCEIGYEIEYD